MMNQILYQEILNRLRAGESNKSLTKIYGYDAALISRIGTGAYPLPKRLGTDEDRRSAMILRQVEYVGRKKLKRTRK